MSSLLRLFVAAAAVVVMESRRLAVVRVFDTDERIDSLASSKSSLTSTTNLVGGSRPKRKPLPFTSSPTLTSRTPPSPPTPPPHPPPPLLTVPERVESTRLKLGLSPGCGAQQLAMSALTEEGAHGTGFASVTGRQPSSVIFRMTRMACCGALFFLKATRNRSPRKSRSGSCTDMSRSSNPKLYTSTFSSYRSPRISSGAQKRGVPTAVIFAASSSRRSSSSSSSSSSPPEEELVFFTREVPKSVILATKKSVMSTLSGFKSRCRMQWLLSVGEVCVCVCVVWPFSCAKPRGSERCPCRYAIPRATSVASLNKGSSQRSAAVSSSRS
mmetsp:Transcript_41757/g.82136  ORF Transcript_41757/g.82136 Transcript_41757/m.82136 type:complete len:327 (-) Transcript_41757:396-1376(-)